MTRMIRLNSFKMSLVEFQINIYNKFITNIKLVHHTIDRICILVTMY